MWNGSACQTGDSRRWVDEISERKLMLHLRQDTLAPPARRSSRETQRSSDVSCAAANVLLERMSVDGVHWEWDVTRREIAIFVRDPKGGDALQPTMVCTLDEWLDCVAPGDRWHLRTKLLSLAAGSTRSFEAQFRVAVPGGRQPWIDLCGIVVRDEHARPLRIVGQQRRLVGTAECKWSPWPSPFHDPLTGLPNRSLFERSLSNAIEWARQEKAHGFAILFVDLDCFKAINDCHGHLMGDQTLLAVAQRFSHCVRPEDVLARRDGDEFTILVKDMCQPDAVVLVAQRILQQLRSPLSLDGATLVVTASIGIALSSSELLTADDLLRSADQAMYQAKARGGDRYVMAAGEIPNRCDPQRIDRV
jgi:diguanylate cyclase (GGDEF)-like protein